MCSSFEFVADPQHPIVKVDNPFLNGAQYQDIIIPCKPTSKMWDIQLIKEGDEVKSKMPLSVVTGEYFRSVLYSITYVTNNMTNDYSTCGLSLSSLLLFVVVVIVVAKMSEHIKLNVS